MVECYDSEKLFERDTKRSLTTNATVLIWEATAALISLGILYTALIWSMNPSQWKVTRTSSPQFHS